VSKRLGLLKEVVPGTRVIDVIANAANPVFVATEWRDTQAAAGRPQSGASPRCLCGYERGSP
jgi:hypothetical protein